MAAPLIAVFILISLFAALAASATATVACVRKNHPPTEEMPRASTQPSVASSKTTPESESTTDYKKRKKGEKAKNTNRACMIFRSSNKSSESWTSPNAEGSTQRLTGSLKSGKRNQFPLSGEAALLSKSSMEFPLAAVIEPRSPRMRTKRRQRESASSAPSGATTVSVDDAAQRSAEDVERRQEKPKKHSKSRSKEFNDLKPVPRSPKKKRKNEALGIRRSDKPISRQSQPSASSERAASHEEAVVHPHALLLPDKPQLRSPKRGSSREYLLRSRRSPPGECSTQSSLVSAEDIDY
ncbi:hypothetical protein L596_018016 [Steinernema carpocapsae]|uniref:Uncharacterized protein n=1 Tax=Steinernema carpocapsae TaxID=34508 RepID=A0A4U5N3E7_STECR|nr:hypothetical protein L596_018016 [Steinernema carpocapsae]